MSTNTAPNPWNRGEDPNVQAPGLPPWSQPSAKQTEPTASPERVITLSQEDQRALKKAFGFDPDDATIVVSAGVTSDPIRRRPTREELSKMTLAEINTLVEQALADIANGTLVSEVTAAETKPAEPDPDLVKKWEAIESKVLNVLTDVLVEVRRSVFKHGYIHSPHEGWSVLLEEVEELWDEIKLDGGGRDYHARKEAIQVAAVAVKYIANLIDKT